jgi:hypothetical protein
MNTSNKIRKDIRGVEPTIGSTIVFNPPKYKGLVMGECIGFTSVGLPQVKMTTNLPYSMKFDHDRLGYYVPKTGFVVV